MSTDSLLSIAFPIVLGLIMFGLGTSLTKEDFQSVKRSPKAVIMGLLIQMIGGPLVAIVAIWLFPMPTNLAFGLLLLAAVPGGSTSNLFSHLAKGDVALNISLTVINSFLSILYVPGILYFLSGYYLETSQKIDVPMTKIIQTIFIVVIPIVIGMIVRKYREDLTRKWAPWISKLAVLFIVILAVIGIKNEWNLLMQMGLMVLAAVITFNLGSLFLAYGASKVMKLSQEQAVAITFEVGIHNCVLAITLAMSPQIFNSMEMAIPAIFYSIFMQFSAGFMVRYFQKKAKA